VALKLSTVRAAVKAADPEATVSVRGLAAGCFGIRTSDRLDEVRAVFLALGLTEVTADIGGSAYDWVHVLHVTA